jgi:hypothetical protein
VDHEVLGVVKYADTNLLIAFNSEYTILIVKLTLDVNSSRCGQIPDLYVMYYAHFSLSPRLPRL